MHVMLENASAILFDLDGTLVDSVPDLARAVDLMLAELGLPVAGQNKVRTWVGNGAPALVKRALADDAQGDKSGRVADELYQRAYPIFSQAYLDCAVHATGMYPGVLECLQLVADKPTALITNKPRKFTLLILESLNILQYFDVVVCGDDYAEKKPSPLPLLKALESLDQNARQAVMIGDSISDITSAKAAGCQSVAVTYGYNHGNCARQLPADLIIDSLDELA